METVADIAKASLGRVLDCLVLTCIVCTKGGLAFVTTAVVPFMPLTVVTIEEGVAHVIGVVAAVLSKVS